MNKLPKCSRIKGRLIDRFSFIANEPGGCSNQKTLLPYKPGTPGWIVEWDRETEREVGRVNVMAVKEIVWEEE